MRRPDFSGEKIETDLIHFISISTNMVGGELLV